MTENAPTYTAEELARIEEFEAPYLQKIAERGITQNDIDVLNAINQQVLVTKKQNKDDIILWLLEHSNFATEDYIDPYIFSQYLRKNNIENKNEVVVFVTGKPYTKELIENRLRFEIA